MPDSLVCLPEYVIKVVYLINRIPHCVSMTNIIQRYRIQKCKICLDDTPNLSFWLIMVIIILILVMLVTLIILFFMFFFMFLSRSTIRSFLYHMK